MRTHKPGSNSARGSRVTRVASVTRSSRVLALRRARRGYRTGPKAFLSLLTRSLTNEDMDTSVDCKICELEYASPIICSHQFVKGSQNLS